MDIKSGLIFGNINWPFKGEMSWVFKAEVIKNFSFPIYEGEKFCQEAVIILQIIKKYRILFTDHILVHGDYLEDGLSQNIYERLLKNPNYGMLSYKEKLLASENNIQRYNYAKVYWDIAMKTGGGFWKNINGIPFYWTLIVFFRKIKNIIV